MTTLENLVEGIENLGNKKTIGKKERTIINEGLEIIKEYTTTQENKQIEKFNEIIEADRITIDTKKEIEAHREKMIKIINKYEEYFNDEPNEDEIDDNATIEEVEEILDNKVDAYKFTKNNPMKGISYDKTTKRYNININKQNKKFKTLKDGANYVKENMVKNGEKNPKNIQKIKFIYAEHYFISYWYQNEPYFDMQHILSLLNVDESTARKKYNEHSKEIEYYTFHPNSFGGYILRELIPETTFYDIIMHSNSVFSKKFKKDVIKILRELRKSGQLKITNDEMTLKNNKSAIVKYSIEDTPYPLYSKNNERHVKFMNKLIDLGKKISLINYAGKHVLYAYIVDLDIAHGYYIIKFGYTYNLSKRKKDLMKEYKANFYLLRAKIITSEDDEEKFHTFLKMAYSELVEDFSINGKKKTELYKFTPKILEEYKNYLNDDNPDYEFDANIITEINFNQISQNPNMFYSDKMIDFMIKQMSDKHEEKMTELRYRNGGKEVDINIL